MTCLYPTISLAQSGLENISEHSQCDTMVFVSGRSRAILIHKECGVYSNLSGDCMKELHMVLILVSSNLEITQGRKAVGIPKKHCRQGIAHNHLRYTIECQKLARKVWVNSCMEKSGTQKCTEEYRTINIIENS